MLAVIGIVFLKVFSAEAQYLEPKIFGDRIVGGISVTGENIFQVALSFKGEFICGGSIFNDEWIITSAQCMKYPDQKEYYHIEYGSNERYKGELVKISEIITHPKYNRFPIKNDLALIKTAMKMKLGNKTALIELYNDAVGDNAIGNIYGWGRCNSNAIFSSQLQKATVERVKCPTYVHESYICMNSEKSSPCEKDWGGPLVIDTKLAGIASQPVPQTCQDAFKPKGKKAKNKCRKGISTAYTKINEFENWINENTSKTSSQVPSTSTQSK